MVKLCDAAGYVLQVELGVRINKPRLAAVRPKYREFQCNSVERARGNIGLIRVTRGQSWIARHRDTFELRFVVVACGKNREAEHSCDEKRSDSNT